MLLPARLRGVFGKPSKLGVMRKPIPVFWQGVGAIVLGALMYLVDCFFQHPSHPDVSWIRSGTCSSFGILCDAVLVLAGIYILVRNGY